MSIRHSTDNRGPSCLLCRRPLNNQVEVLRTACNHCFHRPCLFDWLQNNHSCPQCRGQCRRSDFINAPGNGVTTRSQARKPSDNNRPSTSSSDSTRPATSGSNIVEDNTIINNNVPQESRAAATSSQVGNSPTVTETLTTETNPEETRIKNLITAVISARKETLLGNIEQQIADILDERLNVMFRRMNFPQQQQEIPNQGPSQRENVSNYSWPQESPVNLGLDSSERASRDRNSLIGISAGKIGQMISNWEIRFDGSTKLSVESFIYRIKCQVDDTLGGDTNLLCEHAHCLFLGDAKDWYWRYRRSVEKVTWASLCDALKINFGSFRSDTEIIEFMKNRKQGPTETYDSYKNAVLKISESLDRPISDNELLRILETGLRPRIRQQLLHIDITSLAQLRKLCLKGEYFHNELARSNFTSHNTHNRTKSSQISAVEEVDSLDEPEELLDPVEVDEVKRQKNMTILRCWNCQEHGHRYQDCLNERTVFCYGCGAPKTYKPQCEKCSGNGQKFEGLMKNPR